MFGRSKVAMLVAEFFGTAVLVLTILATSKSGVGISYFLGAGVAVALGVLVLMVGRHTAAHFNPAVTVGLWTARKVTTLQAIVYLAAQFLGAMGAWQLYEYLADQPLKNVANANFDWRVLVAEMVGTLIFTMGVAAAVYQAFAGLKWAVTVGGALFLGVLVASLASNGVVNPAVALGVQSWSKAYVIGPILGGIIGVNLYSLLFAPAEATVGGIAPFPPTRSILSRVLRRGAPKAVISNEKAKPMETKTRRKTAKSTARRRR